MRTTFKRNSWKYIIPTIPLLMVLMVFSGCASLSLEPKVSRETLEKESRRILFEAVEHENPLVRVHAIESLAHHPDRQTIPFIRKGLYDDVAAVRFAAAVAVGDVEDYASRHLLEKMLRDDNVSVQLAAGYALERMGDNRFHNWFDKVLFSRHEQLAGTACLLLGKLGNTALRSDSREKLWTVFNMKDQYPSVQLQAAEALARLDDPDVLEKLLVFSNSIYADDRLLAVEGLKQLSGRDMFAMLTVLADDPQSEVRLAAIRALGPLADRDHVQTVRNAVNYTDPEGNKQATMRVRNLALLALGSVGEAGDAGCFMKAYKNPSPFMRVAAARAAVEYLNRQ